MQKLFLIEDDEYLGRVYERAFRFAGFEVEIIRDGEEALRTLSNIDSVPVAVIMDIKMPKIGGFELLQAVRKDPRYNQVPIVMLTNSFTENEPKRFLDAGADLYLIKIEEQTKDVVQKVQEVINKGRSPVT